MRFIGTEALRRVLPFAGVLGLSIWASLHVAPLQAALSNVLGINPVDEFTAMMAPAGSSIYHELFEPARPAYGPRSSSRTMTPYARSANRAGYRYDRELEHAAREIAQFYRATRRLAPSGVLAFVLDSAGAAFWGVRQTVVVTTDATEKALTAVLSRPDASEEGWSMGIGELWIDESPPLRIIVGLSARQHIRLDALPRRYEAGQPIEISGQVLSDHRDLFALAMGPGGAVETLQLSADNGRFQGRLEAQPGEWVVELIGTNAQGPIPLAQLTLYVDSPVPTAFSDVWPPIEAALPDVTHYMIRLINAERARQHLPPLKRSEQLDQVARAHSRDMRSNRFVGHVSPSTGTVNDRLNLMEIDRVAHGENVALNSSVTDAHHGLMRSLGHRRNLLSPAFKEIGIGLVSSREGWYVTQVFSTPAPETASRLEGLGSLAQSASKVRR